MYPDNIKYTSTHEWVREEDGLARIGITYHAVEELGDVVNVELPKVGAKVRARDSVASVDSVKATSDIYSPVDGEVVEVNEKLTESPELIRDEPYDAGWMFRVRVEDPSELDELMTSDQYKQHI